jgi:hypothetical protein
MVGSLSFRFRTNLSVHHIKSGFLFADKAGEIERNYNGKFNEELFFEHRSYVISAVLSSVAFLEATINEIFADSIDHPTNLQGLSNIQLIAQMAKHSAIEQAKTINKYNLLLALCGKNEIELDRLPGQSIRILIDLRNELIHYKPVWLDSESNEDYSINNEPKISKSLRGKFPDNPLTGLGNPFFPDKALSYGCAKWAVTSGLAFTDEFYSRLGINSLYHKSRNTLILS